MLGTSCQLGSRWSAPGDQEHICPCLESAEPNYHHTLKTPVTFLGDLLNTLRPKLLDSILWVLTASHTLKMHYSGHREKNKNKEKYP